MLTETLAGKTCLVTGATDGIGKVTARKLAELGARVWIVGRNEEKARTVAAEIARRTGEGSVAYRIADLSRMVAVRDLAHRLRDELDRLDVLVNNVGALFTRLELTPEGFERTFALNHLGPFLLTHHLRPLLEASAPARIVNVSSEAHRGPGIDFDNLNGEHGYSGWKAYQVSKLENLLFTYELAERLAGTGVVANALHPGFVASRFARDNPGLYPLLVRAAQALFAISEEKGAETSVFVASSPEVEGVTGKYFVRCRERSSSRASYDPEARRRLWEESERLLTEELA